MGSFGDKLRREREMRGVTLDEISESTKISRRHLESLEKEDFTSLPGGVFNKGFVRAYARFLGINEDQAVADYATVAQEPAAPEDEFPLDIHEEPNRELNPRHSNLPLLLAVAALVGVVIVYSIWFRGKRAEHPDAVAASKPVPAAANTPQPRPASVTRGEETPGQEKTVSAPLMPTAAPPPAPLAKKSSDEVAAAHKRPERTFFIVIKAKEDAWISVIADGRMVAQGVLNQDKQKLVKAGKQIILKTGNAGGIEVSYNGRPLGPIGSESETRTLMFTPTGPAQ
ncbi:MAG TPA: helix-turn-helix domain-containing protein [Terriglobales bacterium]|nr:helix-turn-helix domain-containing protein [Terriglobales bacterium]